MRARPRGRSVWLPGAVALLVLVRPLAAHDGETHDEPPALRSSSSASDRPLDRPRRLPDGSLVVAKPVQRLLGLRTATWSSEDAQPAITKVLLAEVSAQPASALAVVAGEAGQIEATDAGWPLPGRVVHRGDRLAWLRPALARRDIEARRAQLADLDQRLIIADLNVDRLRVQNEATEGSLATGNVYYEQTRAERDAMRQQRALLAESIDARIALRAPADGRVLAVTAAAGDVVAAGQPVFQLGARQGLRLIAISYDAGLAARIRGAHRIVDPDAGHDADHDAIHSRARGRDADAGNALRPSGVEPVADGPGWRLSFDLPAQHPDDLVPGQLVRIALDLAPLPETLGIPAGSCAINREGLAEVWLHPDAERFVPLAVGRCDAPRRMTAAVQGAQRIVVDGAALLSAY